MAMRDQIYLLSAFLILVSACKPREPPHDVAWYLTHPDATMSKVKWCTDSEDRRITGDCQNALQAEARLSVGSQRELPPLDWNAASAPH
jgi:hypothetical protein